MTNAQWTAQHHEGSLPLNERAAGGRGFWLIGRVLLGGLFLMSGVEKLMGLDQFAASLVKGGIPETITPMLAPFAAGVETLGGLLIVVGLATSWASLVMLAFTIVAAFVSHRFWDAPPDLAELQTAHFMKNIMIVGAFMMLYVAGGGPCSIDRWWRDRGS